MNLRPSSPRCAVGVLVQGGQVLLGLRNPHRRLYPSKWDFFGGHAEPGESLENCLIRELQEELSITPAVFTPTVVIPEPTPGTNGERTYHLFWVTAWAGSGPSISNHEHTEIAWVTPEEALQLDLALEEYRPVLRELGR